MSEIDKPADAAFLSRWSRRKVEAATADGAMVPARPPPGTLSNLPPALPAASGSLLAGDPHADQNPGSSSGIGAPPGTKVPETPHPEPTLPAGPEVKPELPAIDSLTHEADFSPFMARDVDPGLRNQAMKKLFTDPHYQFGQMDKLDIYIDDYSQPDPIPLEMLRQMNQAKNLFLFEDEKTEALQGPDQPADCAATSAPAAINAAESDVAVPKHVACAAAGTATTAAADEGPHPDVDLAGKSIAGKIT